MDSIYAPSLVWVCLACGQLAPHHTSPSDLLDSADAMDFAMPQFSASHASSTTRGFEQRRGEAFAMSDNPNGAHLGRGGSRGSSGSEGCGGAACAQQQQATQQYLHHPQYHSHRSPSRGHAHSCLNNESDSYLSIGAAISGKDEGSAVQRDPLSGQHLHHHHHHSHHHTHVRPSAAHDGSSYGASSLQRQPSTTAAPSAQSIAALLMEEHLVGTREMRFCESCREVRCAEIRKTADMLPRDGDAGGGEGRPVEQRMGYPDTLLYSSYEAAPSPHARHTSEGREKSATATAFLYSCELPPADASATDNNCNDGAVHDSRSSLLQRTTQHRGGRVSPTVDSQQRKRSTSSESRHGIPSGHLVVAVSLARLLVKLKDAATALLHNLHPLYPSLPAAYFRRPSTSDREEDDDEEGGGARDGMEVDDDHDGDPSPTPHPSSPPATHRNGCHGAPPADDVCARSNRQHDRLVPRPPSPTTALAASYDSPSKPFHAPSFSSFVGGSSLDNEEAAAAAEACGVDSNGISYNSFSGSPTLSQPPQQQQQLTGVHHRWPSPELESLAVKAEQAQTTPMLRRNDAACESGSVPDRLHRFPSSADDFADAALAAADVRPTSTTSTGSNAAATAVVLRASKERWNALSVAEALWRLVLPTFSGPFLTVARAEARGGGSSSHSSPLRRGDKATDAPQPGYRCFRVEVGEAVSQLDTMQLEVAKLRLEQMLAEVEAEQRRRGEEGDEDAVVQRLHHDV